MKPHQHRPETEAVRGGTDLSKKNGPLATPIYQTSTFEVTDSDQQVRATHTDMFYTRYGNPTHTVAENAIAELEGAAAALLFSSGMTAITTTILALLKSGDHVVAQRDIYGGVTKFFTQWLPKLGIETTFVSTTDYDQHVRAIRPNTKLQRVHYPFLEGHAQRALAMTQMNGGGGVLSFEVDGSGEDARRVAESLRLFTLAPSLGGVESLVTIPVLTSHAMISAQERAEMGVTEQLIRLAVGIENADDLIHDLDQGLSVLAASGQHAEVARR